MATTTKKPTGNQRVKGDSEKPYDAVAARCPECGSPIHMYVPPDRHVGGATGYPALLIHYEIEHTSYVGGRPQGWPLPPPPPMIDEVILNEETGAMKKSGKKVVESWETEPPDREEWRPVDRRLAENNLPQPDGVWPPVRSAERP